MGCFIFCMWYTFTSKMVVVIEMPEWKFKTEIARNTIFEGNYDKMFACFGSKIAKSDYIRGLYFSQSLSHILGNKYNFSLSEELRIKILLKEFHI